VHVFVDYDGTITDLDTFDVLVRAYAGEDVWQWHEDRLRSGIATLRETLGAQAGHVRCTLDEAEALLARETRFDPAFAAFARRCAKQSAPLTILSSGIQPLIERALAREGLAHLDVRANGVDASPAGWVMTFRDASANGHDKTAEVAAAASAGERTVFVGDGHSDFDAALAADVRFAKRGRALERYLRERRVPFTPFDSFATIERELFDRSNF
jgi:HAD superfamily phosphoserine phosphatase-like hydrolase